VGAEASDSFRILDSFRLVEGIYALGCFEAGLTVYSQQVRAHNLAWALHAGELKQVGAVNVAIVGGGIAALTLAAGLVGRRSDVNVYLFEKRAHLCPLQLGCDTRWLHPHFYNWPLPGSLAPSAQLPLLTWETSRASDVVHQILGSFETGRNSLANDELHIYLDVEHMTIDVVNREIEWIGRAVGSRGRAPRLEGQRTKFDAIVLATGFGVEDQVTNKSTPSYWRNESYGQPILDGATSVYGISGYGDGALIDLARLTIERYRQDRIVDDLLAIDSATEQAFAGAIRELKFGDNCFDLLRALEYSHLSGKIDLLRRRLRTDTKVGMYLGGKKGLHKSIRDVFVGKVSNANRLIFYFLFRCGAFEPFFTNFDDWKTANGVAEGRCIIRHGSDPTKAFIPIFSDPDSLTPGIKKLRSEQAQHPTKLYPVDSPPTFFGV
jgi:hypothetical protein